jgi:hypothetical protein
MSDVTFADAPDRSFLRANADLAIAFMASAAGSIASLVLIPAGILMAVIC